MDAGRWIEVAGEVDALVRALDEERFRHVAGMEAGAGARPPVPRPLARRPPGDGREAARGRATRRSRSASRRCGPSGCRPSTRRGGAPPRPPARRPAPTGGRRSPRSSSPSRASAIRRGGGRSPPRRRRRSRRRRARARRRSRRGRARAPRWGSRRTGARWSLGDAALSASDDAWRDVLAVHGAPRARRGRAGGALSRRPPARCRPRPLGRALQAADAPDRGEAHARAARPGPRARCGSTTRTDRRSGPGPTWSARASPSARAAGARTGRTSSPRWGAPSPPARRRPPARPRPRRGPRRGSSARSSSSRAGSRSARTSTGARRRTSSATSRYVACSRSAPTAPRYASRRRWSGGSPARLARGHRAALHAATSASWEGVACRPGRRRGRARGAAARRRGGRGAAARAVERFDEDWWRNPRTAAHLAGLLAAGRLPPAGAPAWGPRRAAPGREARGGR